MHQMPSRHLQIGQRKQRLQLRRVLGQPRPGRFHLPCLREGKALSKPVEDHVAVGGRCCPSSWMCRQNASMG